MFELRTIAVIPDGAFSAFVVNGRPFAVTCEHTFDDGRPIIGNGVYRCRKTFFNRGQYESFEILVPGHDRVLFHKGNTEVDSRGCVLIGAGFTVIDGHAAIADSAKGFAEFWNLAKYFDAFDLVVSGR